LADRRVVGRRLSKTPPREMPRYLPVRR